MGMTTRKRNSQLVALTISNLFSLRICGIPPIAGWTCFIQSKSLFHLSIGIRTCSNLIHYDVDKNLSLADFLFHQLKWHFLLKCQAFAIHRIPTKSFKIFSSVHFSLFCLSLLRDHEISNSNPFLVGPHGPFIFRVVTF